MPFGFERINARQKSPNERIIFIKPLEGLHKDISLDFLQRVAAICTPIMTKNSISVLTLEEFEPNFEFVGRNFNAGEVIQLVLRSPTTGRWLPFRYVQMVMMHELAHCKQMNHSRAFWRIRNEYAEELKNLWTKNYSGDGLWGRGQSLYDGQYTADSIPDLKGLPEHLCGGTYSSSGRKRKRKTGEGKQSLSYAERKQRRIAKKFGVDGKALGSDENIKAKLENGRKAKGNPRVAQSARGRDLRAAAALARLEESRANGSYRKQIDLSDTEDSDAEVEDTSGENALDADGNEILDSEGQRLVKICDKEDLAADDADAARELNELGCLTRPELSSASSNEPCKHRDKSSLVDVRRTDSPKIGRTQNCHRRGESSSTPETLNAEDTWPTTNRKRQQSYPPNRKRRGRIDTGNTEIRNNQSNGTTVHAYSNMVVKICRVCSFENDTESCICIVCANVLDPDALLDYWRCSNSTCRANVYINHGDNGICGLCGRPRISQNSNNEIDSTLDSVRSV